MPRKAKSASVDSAQSEAVEAVLAKHTPAGADGAVPGADIPAGGINDKIRHLIRLSKEQGYLTFDDINEALPESVENQEEIDNVLSILQNLEIEILEPDQVEDYKARQEEAEEEEVHPLSTALFDLGSGVTSHIGPRLVLVLLGEIAQNAQSDAATLLSAAAVVRERGDVLD